MAIITAKYTSTQSNSESLNTTPHELNNAMGLIGGNPNGRFQSVTDYVKKFPDFIATVTSSQIKVSFKPTQNADFYFGIFNQNYSGPDAAYLFNNITGTITGWTAGVTGAANDRYTVTGINIDAQTYFNNATWASVLAGNDTLVGGPGSDSLQDYGGNNLFKGMGDNDTFIAAAGGVNTAIFRGKSTDYSIKSSARIEHDGLIGLKGYTADDSVSGRDGFTQMINVNRLSFTDTMLALDTGKDQTAGSGYMLYKAAFNRTPDAGGLGFWISKMDGGMSYNDVAKNFVNSTEFKDAFGGSNPTVNTLVTKLYNNVLNRAPDAGGLAFWQEKLTTGWSTADVLGYFSTSGENVTNVTPLIANGIQYQQFVG